MKRRYLFLAGVLALTTGTATVTAVQAQSLGHILKDAVIGHSPYEGYNSGYYAYPGNSSYNTYNPYVVPGVSTYSSVINPYFNTPYAGYGTYVRPKGTIHRMFDSFIPYHLD